MPPRPQPTHSAVLWSLGQADPVRRPLPLTESHLILQFTVLPVAIGLGEGSTFQAQMAIAVIGGLVTSTGLTLVMVPAAFTWMDDLERWVGGRIGRRLIAVPATSAGDLRA